MTSATTTTSTPDKGFSVRSLRRNARLFFKAVAHRIYLYLRGFYDHAEAILILVAASLGFNALLSELPFLLTLPLWIESTMVIPVIAVFGVLIITWNMNRRAKKRHLATV